MGRKIYDEDLRLNLILNGEGLNAGSKQMVTQLGVLEQKLIGNEQAAKALSLKIKELSKDKIANAQAIKVAEREYRLLTQTMRATQMQIDQLRKQVGLAGMTLEQLRNHLNALKVQLYNMPGSMGTPMFRALQREIAATEARITTLTTGASRLAQAWTRLEKAANRAGTVIGWAALIIFGISRVISGVIDRMKTLEDLIGSTRKNTNLLNAEVWEMKDAFDQWDTRTKTDDLLKLAIVAGKLGIEGKDNIMRFVDVANKIQLALGDDLQGSVEDTVTSLGKLMNAFRIDKKMPIDVAMLRTGDVLNQLAKSSAASAGTILEYMTRLSAVSELAGFTIDQIGGLGSTLDALHVPSERGATAMQKIMIQLGNPKKISAFAEAINSVHPELNLVTDDLGTMSQKYKELVKNDPNFVLMTLLKKFVSGRKGITDMNEGLKEFGVKGQYMTAVLGSLALNLDVLDQQQRIAKQAWIDNTSVLSEYNIMNNNFTAEIEKQHREVRRMTDQMDKDAEPAVLRLTKAWTWFVSVVKGSIDVIVKYWTVIKLLTFSYIALHAPMIYHTSLLVTHAAILKYTNILNALKVLGMKLENIWIIITTSNQALLNKQQLALIGSSKILTIVNVALTKGLRAAVVEMRGMMVAGGVMSAPIVALAATIAVLAGAMYVLIIRSKDLTEAQKRDHEMRKKINDDYFTEKGRLDVLIEQLKDVNLSQKERNDLIKQIQDQYGEYLPLLQKEGLTADEVTASYDKLVYAMGRKILRQNLMDTAGKNSAEMQKSKIELDKAQTAYDDAVKNNTDPGSIPGLLETRSEYEMKAAERNLKKWQKIYKEYFDLDLKYNAELQRLNPPKILRTPEVINSEIRGNQNDIDRLKGETSTDYSRIDKLPNGEERKQEIAAYNAKLEKINELTKANRMLGVELTDLAEKEAAANQIKTVESDDKNLAERQKDRDDAFKKEENDLYLQFTASKINKEKRDAELRQLNLNYLNATIKDLEDHNRTEDGDADAYYALVKKRADLIASDDKKNLSASKKTNKEKLDDLDALNDKEKAAINLRHLQEGTSEDQFQDDLLKQQLIYYSEKMKLFEKDHLAYVDADKKHQTDKMLKLSDDEKEYQEAQLKYYETTNQAQDKINKLILQAQKEIARKKVDNLNEGIEKEVQLENDRWEDERDALETRLIVKERLSMDEYNLNEKIYRLIELAAAKHEIALKKIISPADKQKLVDLQFQLQQLNKMGNMTTFSNIGQIKQHFAQREAIIKQQYEIEIQAAEITEESKAAIESKYNETMIGLLNEQYDAEMKMHDAKMQMSQSYLTALGQIVTGQTDMVHAVFLIQQAFAIADVWIKTFATNAIITSNALATFSVLPFGAGIPVAFASAAPTIAANTSNAWLATGLILAQTLGEVVQWANGRYPVIGADDGQLYNAVQGGSPITGIYSQPTLLDMAGGRSLVGERAPELVVDGDTFRRIQLNAPELLRDIYAFAGMGRGRKDGSHTPQYAAGSYPATLGGGSDSLLLRRLTDRNDKETAAAINRLNVILEKGINAKVNKFGHNGLSEAYEDIEKFNNKTK